MTEADRLNEMIDRFTPEVAASARAALDDLRAMLPGALELVYDNYNALAIAFAGEDRRQNWLFSIALYPRWVSLFVTGAPDMPDPDGLFEGGGGTMRHIKLRNGLAIADPRIASLVRARFATGPGWDTARAGRIVIKSVSPNRRPRRP